MMKYFEILYFFIFDRELTSYLKPETSLIKSILYLIPLSITSDFLVSKDKQLFLNFFLKFFKTYFILFHSFLGLIVFEPGLVDSPPTSIMSAP